jgi:FkbM family methyltransferase
VARVRGTAVRLRALTAKIATGTPKFGIRTTAEGIGHLIWLRLRRPDATSVTVADPRADMTFWFSVPSQVMPMLVIFRGFIEPEFELFDRILRPGATFFDVGGGIGTYSVFAAIRTGAPVHVFEPTAENASAIRRNAESNQVEEFVLVHETALSSSPGFTKIVSGHNTFTNKVGAVVDSDSEDGAAVPVTTLDEFCRSHGIAHIDVLKVDVAGYEAAVFEGATRMLSEQAIDVVTLELSLDFLDTYLDLERWGYTCCFTVDGDLVPIGPLTQESLLSRRPSVFHANVVAVSSKSSDAIRSRTTVRGS